MSKIWAVALVAMLELCRRKDVYVLFILTTLITLLAGSVNLFNESHIVRYVKEICLLLIWICMLVIAVTMAARHLPMEREQRTIFPLLAKPITRTQVLLGKFLGCWLSCLVSLVLFYALFGSMCFLRETDWRLLNYLQAMLLHAAVLAVVVSMALLGSVIFAAPSSTTTIVSIICAAILLVGRHLHKVALRLAEPQQTLLTILYYAVPHLELFDVRDLIIHNWPLIPWGVCALAILYGGAYTCVFLALACWRFSRKSVVA